MITRIQMNLFEQNTGRGTLVSGVLLLLGSLWMMPHGDFFDPSVFRHFWFGYALMGLGYALTWKSRRVTPLQFWAIALLCRLILLPMHPGDDIWRYLWEGLIQNHGISPYHFAPNAPELADLRTSWWALINHPDTSAIYPPITQWGFRGLAAIAPNVILFKLAFVAADLAVCYLLANRYGPHRAIDYGWNPIVLYSFAGGGHYDSWFVLAVVLAWLSFDPAEHSPRLPRQTYGWSALWLGISIAIKWISLPMLAFIGWRSLRQGHGRWLPLIILLGMLPIVITALPFCSASSCPLVPTGSDFVTRGRSAHVIPYLVSQVWDVSRQENWLFAIPLALWVSWLLIRAASFLAFAEWYFFGLLLLSPVIHGWYFTWLVPFAVATQNWGTRAISLSASVYFALSYRQALGISTWLLTPIERIALWVPFIGCWLGHTGDRHKNRPQNPMSTPNPTANSYSVPSSHSGSFQLDRRE